MWSVPIVQKTSVFGMRNVLIHGVVIHVSATLAGSWFGKERPNALLLNVLMVFTVVEHFVIRCQKMDYAKTSPAGLLSVSLAMKKMLDRIMEPWKIKEQMLMLEETLMKEMFVSISTNVKSGIHCFMISWCTPRSRYIDVGDRCWRRNV